MKILWLGIQPEDFSYDVPTMYLGCTMNLSSFLLSTILYLPKEKFILYLFHKFQVVK